MDFIERVFGMSPDGGSGLYEVLLLLLPVVGVVVGWRARSQGSGAGPRRGVGMVE